MRCSDWNGLCDPNKRPASFRKCHPQNGIICGQWILRPWKDVIIKKIELRFLSLVKIKLFSYLFNSSVQNHVVGVYVQETIIAHLVNIVGHDCHM